MIVSLLFVLCVFTAVRQSGFIFKTKQVNINILYKTIIASEKGAGFYQNSENATHVCCVSPSGHLGASNNKFDTNFLYFHISESSLKDMYTYYLHFNV